MMNNRKSIALTLFKKQVAVACVLLLLGTAAGADSLVGEPVVPYISVLGGINKSLRSSDQFPAKLQANGQFISAFALDSAVSFEINSFFHAGADVPRGYGAGVDLALRDPDGTPGILLLAGFGAQRRDDSNNLLPYADIGAGLVMPINNRLRLRTDARLYATRETTTTTGRDLLFEARLGVGLEFAYLDPFFRAPVVVCGDACAPPPPAPSPDSDGDGIADDVDQCPGNLPQERVGSDGCALRPVVAIPPTPPPPVVVLERVCPTVNLPSLKFDEGGCLVPQLAQVYEITFELDGQGTKLTADGALKVDDLAIALRARPNLSIVVVSHTDSLGAQPYNLTLSERRAQLINARLIGRRVSPERIKAEGAGEADPLDPGNTAEAWARNDRIELRIVSNSTGN